MVLPLSSEQILDDSLRFLFFLRSKIIFTHNHLTYRFGLLGNKDNSAVCFLIIENRTQNINNTSLRLFQKNLK